MQTRAFFLLLSLLLSPRLFAQDVYTSSGKPVHRARQSQANKASGFDPDKMIYGGGVTLGFGGGTDPWSGRTYNSFTIGASPIAGYRLTDDFMAGVGLGYLYQNVTNVFQSPAGQLYPSRRHFVTPSAWARYGLFESVFLQGEFEYNFLNYNDLGFDASGNVINRRTTLSGPALLLGGGLRQRISDRASILVTVLYNVLQSSSFNPYIYDRNLIFRTGISIGY